MDVFSDFTLALTRIAQATPTWAALTQTLPSDIPSAVLCLWLCPPSPPTQRTKSSDQPSCSEAFWLSWGEGGSVLLTLRPHTLPQHPGQVSFPGGVMKGQASDLESPRDCALRETYEEVGIRAESINVLGYLPPYRVKTGFLIQPLVGMAPAGMDYQINTVEVDRIFEVPWNYIANPRHWRRETYTVSPDLHYQWFAFDWQGVKVWGATAAILQTLMQSLADVIHYPWKIIKHQHLSTMS